LCAPFRLEKEVRKMFPVEIIVVLGLLYCFFMIGILRAWRAKRALRESAKIRERRRVEGVLTGSSQAAN